VSAGAAWQILLPFYPAYVRGQKAVTVAATSRQLTADKTGKGKFFRGNRRNLAGEGVVRKSSSPQRVACVSNLCNSRSQGAGNMGNGECCSGFDYIGIGGQLNIATGQISVKHFLKISVSKKWYRSVSTLYTPFKCWTVKQGSCEFLFNFFGPTQGGNINQVYRVLTTGITVRIEVMAKVSRNTIKYIFGQTSIWAGVRIPNLSTYRVSYAFMCVNLWEQWLQ